MKSTITMVGGENSIQRRLAVGVRWLAEKTHKPDAAGWSSLRQQPWRSDFAHPVVGGENSSAPLTAPLHPTAFG